MSSHSNRIPKEQMTAYQRWELESFDEPPPEVRAAEELAARIKKATEEARLAAYAAGLEEGRSAGFAQGKAEGLAQGHAEGLAQGRAQAEEERKRIEQIAQAFGDEIAQANERIASDLLDLALDLSKAMLKTALNVRPDLIIPVVSESVRYLPSLQQPAQLFLHPEDAQLVTTLMGEELAAAGWRIVEDAQIGRSGCRVDTASNQVDATAQVRWQRIAAALGKESDWLA